ncbi:Alpha/Beta hydrolase protein [Paraphoma chrysanthemicola]|uniref:Alpha/Beta hydrolase protein n=1 Tax=Paraphoma chrysanthemicola TaxID=798071 RepID=A0A8K0RH71_9PLEO|nr:Alpha/Beta hydrolase protein [Paraphoma chrysanthemicola]
MSGGYPGAPDVSSVDALRAGTNANTVQAILTEFPNLTCTDVSIPSVKDLGEEPITVAIFQTKTSTSRNRAAILYAHGGGQIAGNRFFGPDQVFRVLPVNDDLVFASVEYRLAPEHPAPAGAYDFYSAAVYLAEHAAELRIDPSRILVQGLSGGAAPVATACLLARDRGYPSLRAALLSFPMLDDREHYPSHQQFQTGTLWCGKQNRNAWDMILAQSRDAPTELQAPGRATDLSRLPPVFIDVGECEVFRDGAVAYASKIWGSGGSCELHVWPGMYHAGAWVEPEVQISKVATAAEKNFVEQSLDFKKNASGVVRNVLPICSQCQSSPSLCRYQEGGKRGLPAAYMISLENRLRHTENALYASLGALQQQGTQSLTSLEAAIEDPPVLQIPRSKAEKQREWEQFPLRTGEDLATWFEQMEQHRDRSRTNDAISTESRRTGPPSWDSLKGTKALAPGREHAFAATSTFSDPQSCEHVIELLRSCKQPTAPNILLASSSNGWRDNYF